MPTLLNGSLDGIPYDELTGSGSGTYSSENAGTSTRRFLIDHKHVDAFCQTLVGKVQQSGISLQQYLSPVRDPDRPWLECKTATYEGYGKAVDNHNINRTIHYKSGAIIVATFGEQERDQNGDPVQNQTYVTEERDIGSQLITLSNKENRLYWEGEEDEPLDEDDTISKLWPKVHISITIHNWFNAAIGSEDSPLLTKSGKINNSTFRALNQSWPAKKLLYVGANATRTFTSQGVSAWKVTEQYIFSREEWNKFFDEKAMEWREVKTLSGKKPYEETSFRSLLP